jgi:hypothetical protein
MTTTEDLLALAAGAAPAAEADADLALFAAAATRGMNSPAVRALRTLRPDHARPPSLPDSPAWRAWLSAAAAIAGAPGETKPDPARASGTPGETEPDPRPRLRTSRGDHAHHDVTTSSGPRMPGI